MSTSPERFSSSSAGSPWRRRLRRGFDFCTAATATAALLGYAARWNWSCELASHFRLQYAAVLTGAAATYALMRRRRAALVALTLALPNVYELAPFIPSAKARPAETAATAEPLVRLTALNVFLWSDDFDRVVRYVRETRPDVFAASEVTAPWAEGLNPLAADYPAAHVFPRNDSYGLAFYSRLPIESIRVETSPVGIPTIVARLRVGRRTVTIFSAHPPPPATPHLAAARNDVLRHLTEMVRGTAGEAVLIGDLNTSNWSPYFHDLTDGAGLVDPRRGRGVMPTWCLPLPAVLRLPLDHCLTTPGVQVVELRTGPNVGSDHLPLETAWQLAPAAP